MKCVERGPAHSRWSAHGGGRRWDRAPLLVVGLAACAQAGESVRGKGRAGRSEFPPPLATSGVLGETFRVYLPPGVSCLEPVKAGCRRTYPRTPPALPRTLHLPPLPPLSPKANTSASAARPGKSLPAEPNRSPAALPPPRQHPSLTRSLPLPALPLTLTPSAGAEALPEWAAGGAWGRGRGTR